jgi:hypothetical protein
MERREFVAGVAGLSASGWLEVTGTEDEPGGSSPTPEVLAHETTDGGTRIPVRLDEGATVTVEVSVERGTGFSVAVMSLDSMTSKEVTGEDEVLAEMDEDGEYLVDVTGEGHAEIRVLRG